MAIFLDFYRKVFTLSSWLDSPGVVLASFISIVTIFKSLQNFLHRVTKITSFEKHLESSSGHTLNFFPKFGETLFQEYVYGGIFHPIYADLV